MTNDDIIKKWLEGTLSDEERLEFEGSEDYADIRKLSDELSSFRAPEYNIDEQYSRLMGKLSDTRKTISIFERLQPALKIAAIIVVSLTIGYFSFNYFNRSAEVEGWIAEQKDVYLPDSSLALVNAGSKIRFTKESWGEERDVELKGEAFFKVKKGSQFNVKTTQGTVTVLGTEFNVKDWDGYYEVTCYSGLVKVTSNNSEVILKPNMAYRILHGNEEHYSVLNKNMPDWIKGESSFKSVPLSFVFEELERQYQVSVYSGNVDMNQLFSGSFSNNNLETALKSITIPVNLFYEINDNKIVIGIENK